MKQAETEPGIHSVRTHGRYVSTEIETILTEIRLVRTEIRIIHTKLKFTHLDPTSTGFYAVPRHWSDITKSSR